MTYYPPSLDDVQGDKLDAPCMAILGELIEYSGPGGFYDLIKAHVDYSDALRDYASGQVIDNDISVSVLVSDVWEKPNGQCRVRLPKIDGISFKPINVRSNQGRDHWIFELKATDV